MSAISDLVGYLDQANADPLGATQSFLPKRKHQRPRARYGRRGIYVVMAPIPGLTPKGVFRDNKAFVFQVPPMNQFGEDGSFNWADYDTPGGQHSQRVNRQLRTVQFDTLFLEWQPEWSLVHTADHVYPAQQAVKDLCSIRDKGQPFHLLAHQSNYQSKYEIDYAATLRSVTWTIQAGETDAYYVTVQFTEFSTPDIAQYLSRSGHPHLPTTLKVASLPSNRDTMAKIAKFYYGDPSKWRLIAAKNGLTRVGPNTKLTTKNVKATRITIPAEPKKAKAKA